MKKNNMPTAKKQTMYRYNKPAAKQGDKKAPLILCYANNAAHAMQIFRERFNGEFIDKSLIEEYVPPKKEKFDNKNSQKKR